MSIRTFSYGAGVQSTAAMVLASQGKVDFQTFIFANVGANSEDPRTLAYLSEIAIPFAERNGIFLVEVWYERKRLKQRETLTDYIYRTRKSIAIPAVQARIGGARSRRTCTRTFKIKPIADWQKANGATAANPAVTGLGISVDEFHRAKTDSGIPWQVLEYPLLDLRLSRRDCEKIIKDAGLPIPPKSSCFFCPFHNRNDWVRLKAERPELFDKAVDIENTINAKGTDFGRFGLRLHPSRVPLAQAVGDQIELLPADDMDNCESGYCMV